MSNLTKLMRHEWFDEEEGMQPIDSGDWYWADDVDKRIKELEELLTESHAYIMMGLTPTADILQRIADIINLSEEDEDDVG